jgi:kynureninase
MINREHCLALDEQDALAELRNEFYLPARTIYLDGNSLGAQPKASVARAIQVLEQEWGADLIRSWNKAGWFDLPLTLGNQLATLIGSKEGETVVTDTTSVNLFKALAAALQMQASQPETNSRRVIVTERSNFPTDVYVAQGLTKWLNRGYQLRLVDSVQELHGAISDDTAVVMLTHVNYRTGELLDMASLTSYAHHHGALVVWDLCHSAGAVQVDLNASNADFAVGCTYKYLNGGPGSPGFIWVPHRHHERFSHPLTGWWGHAAPFEMSPDFEPTSTIKRALCGTQPILSMALVECGLDIFSKTSMQALRKKSLALTDLFIELIESRCGHHPVKLVTPRDHDARGSQVSFEHPHAYAIIHSLSEQGLIGDYREPGIMRFGFTPLYIRFVDVWDAVDMLLSTLDQKKYDVYQQRNAVT